MNKIYCLYKKGSKTDLVAMAYDGLKSVKEVSKEYIEGDWYSYEASDCGKYLYTDTEKKISAASYLFAENEKEKVFEAPTHDWSGREID